MRKGFTLLEVLIVVIIIGILAAIAMPQYINTIEKARGGEAASNIGALRSALDRYWYENNFGMTGATLDNLDIDNPNDITNKLYTYSLDDLSAVGDTRAYTVTAVRTAGGNDYYVEWQQTATETGALYKSANLGGPERP